MSRNAIRLVGTSPPARPAISMARASECPQPNAWMTPPAVIEVASSSAAWDFASCWPRPTLDTSASILDK